MALEKLHFQCIDGVVNSVARYLYELAGAAVGDVQDIYTDAADALMDVLTLWGNNE